MLVYLRITSTGSASTLGRPSLHGVSQPSGTQWQPNQVRFCLILRPFFPESVVGFPPCHQPHLHNLPPRADLLCMEFGDQRSPDPPRKPGAAGLRKKLNWIFCQTGDNRCNKRFGFALGSLNLILLSVLICQEIEGALLLSLSYEEGIVSATYHENEQNTKINVIFCLTVAVPQPAYWDDPSKSPLPGYPGKPVPRSTSQLTVPDTARAVPRYGSRYLI